MNCTVGIAAPDWFYFRPEDLSEIIANISCWPWTRIGLSDWSRINSKTLANIFITGAINQVFSLIIAPIGVISSVCSALSVWRKATVEKERFYVYMLIIAFFDLFFCVLCIPVVLGFGTAFPNVYQYSYFGLVACRVFASVILAMSLAADMCTLMLTFERFMVICKPASFDTKSRMRFTFLSVIIVITVGTTRFLSLALLYKPAASITDENGRVTYVYVPTEVSQTMSYTCLMFFSNTILPFILLFVMLYLTVRIACVIVKRRRSRIHDSASVQQQEAIHQQSTSMLRLLAILVFLYVINQLNLCVYIIESYVVKDVTVHYDSSEEDINYFLSLNYFSWLCSLCGTFSEGFARSVNFYLYWIFTESTRQEFRRILGLKSKNDTTWAATSRRTGKVR